MEGEVPVSELFKKDITIRIISALFAIVLWFFVLDSDNPFKMVTVTVQMKVVNEEVLQERGIALKNTDFKKTIEVYIKGRNEKIASVSSNDFEAVLDLSRVLSVEDKLVEIDFPRYLGKLEEGKDFNVWDVRPRSVALELERIEKNPFRIEIVPEGKLKEGYKIVKMTATPEVVSLQGMDSIIKSVGAIKARVDVSNLDRDLVIKDKECKVFNKNGKEIPELSRNLFAEVKIEVAKEVSVTPVIRGNPAKNHTAGERKARPDKVLITGSPEVLARISEIRTEAVDIENATSNMLVRRKIILPQGVKLANGSKDEVEISVSVEQLAEKEFTVSREEINLINTEIDNSLKYSIVTENVKLGVKGNQKDLAKLDIEVLKPVVDVAGLGEGTHSLPIKIALPANVRLVAEINVEVKIEKR